MYDDKLSSAVTQVRKEHAKVTSATFALQSSSTSGRGCLVCRKNYATEHCHKLTRVLLNECRALLKYHDLCYRCLRKGHMAHGCASTCARSTCDTASCFVYAVTMRKKTMWMNSTGGMRTYCV